MNALEIQALVQNIGFTVMIVAFITYRQYQHNLTMERAGKEHNGTTLGRVIKWSFAMAIRPLFFLVTKLKAMKASITELPNGDFETFKVAQRTTCNDIDGNLTKLTYFMDGLGDYWFKIEKILANGLLIGEPAFERATMTIKQKSNSYI